MISVNRNLQVVRASAFYDLVVTEGFMTPWTASMVFGGFAALSAALGLERAAPTLDITALLLANLLGSVVVVWSIWRLLQSSRTIGLYDALARILFATWQLFAVAHGASFLILGFTCFEVLFAIAQVLPISSPQRVRAYASSNGSGPSAP